ncbi:MAG: deoxyribose-phosphate aldolase [Variovorax sp.]
MSDKADAILAIRLIDLTSLNDADTEQDIRALAARAETPWARVAALCVFPRFVSVARDALRPLQGSVAVATVANFPQGDARSAEAAREVAAAVRAGADEVDVVFPWRALLDGDGQIGLELVTRCREAAGDRVLKVIIESGCLGTSAMIERASELAIRGGADFLKTSTGKVQVNATLAAAETMLGVIRERGRSVGFKASGGVRTLADAQSYLELARRMMGEQWLVPANFRFGASGLLQDLLRSAGDEDRMAPARADRLDQ